MFPKPPKTPPKEWKAPRRRALKRGPSDKEIARREALTTLRRAVLERDRHCCRAPDCQSARFKVPLNCHHVVFRSHCGPDTMENLVTLCLTCHDRVHLRAEPYLYIRYNEIAADFEFSPVSFRGKQ